MTGLRIRQGISTVIGSHFENNAGHAMHLGTEGNANVSVINANVGGAPSGYTQPTPPAINHPNNGPIKYLWNDGTKYELRG